MKTYFKSILIAALSLTSVQLLVSCGPKSAGLGQNGLAGPSRPASGSTAGGSPVLSAQGTSDSGGGTGINDKVYESYVVDPTSLAVYKKIIAPLLSNIKSEDSEGPLHYEELFKTKTWYIAPVELEKISKDLLGVSFVKSSTQQIARQTTESVWIDKRIFDRMTDQDQATLILHEFVMDLYFLKFKSMSDLCHSTALFPSETQKEGCGQSAALLDKAMPPEKFHALNEDDNENIRFVTAWLEQNAQQEILQSNFMKVLYLKNFDHRLFNPSNYGKQQGHSQAQDLKISGKELYNAVKGAAITGHTPDSCFGMTSGKSKPCKITIAEKSAQLQKMTVNGYELSVSAEGETAIHMFFFASDETLLNASDDGEGGIIYTLAVSDWRDQVRMGDHLYAGFLVFRKDTDASQSTLSFDSLIFKPGVVVSLDKTREPVCLVNAPKIQNFFDDAVIAKQAVTKLNLAISTLAATPPFAACSKDNIAE